jgi:prepilin-type N-terminal cleavage/methylation domain-containing protein
MSTTKHLMKDRGARRRRRARLASQGFTLIELMVVVVLVALLAVLATPSFKEARDDRIAFDYARQYQQLLVEGRSRAAGTGGAHLVLLTPGQGGTRGAIRLYSALDNTPDPAGPNPVSSCKLNPDQWTAALPEPTGQAGQFMRSAQAAVQFVNFAEINRPGVNEDMDLRATLSVGYGNAGLAPLSAVAVCITPAGVTYVGAGGSAAEAVAEMRGATPFTGIVQVDIQRHRAGAPIGLRRIVSIVGGGAPRLRSE